MGTIRLKKGDKVKCNVKEIDSNLDLELIFEGEKVITGILKCGRSKWYKIDGWNYKANQLIKI